MVQLFGDPFNLQGGANPHQTAPALALQPAASPQQPVNPQQSIPPKQTTPIAPRPVATTTPKPQPAPVNTNGLVGTAFSRFIGTRPSPVNPSVAEFFRTDTNQALTPQQLFSYASTLGLGQIGSFEQLKSNAQATPVLSLPMASPAPALSDPNQALAESAARRA